MLKTARKVIQLLKTISTEAESFDTLSDTEVTGARQGAERP